MDITIYGSEVHCGKVTLGKPTTSVSKFCQAIQESRITGMDPEPIPDCVKWICRKGPRAIYILELKPELRLVNWGADGYQDDEGNWNYEHDQDSTPYTVATPYVVMATIFTQGRAYGDPLTFYRNEPLKSLDDPLFQTNLMNVGSQGYTCVHPEITKHMSVAEQLGEIVNAFWSGEFNGHMSGSNWHDYLEDGSDSRLKSIESWQAASLKDPKFVLDVEWMGGSHWTPRNIIKDNLGCGFPTSSGQLANQILLY